MKKINLAIVLRVNYFRSKSLKMDVNTENVFEREIKMCELFRDNEENSRINIAFNVSSGGITVWVSYKKEDDWEELKG